MKIHKVLFFGDRNWGDTRAIQREVRLAKARAKRKGAELVIIEGGAPGADRLSAIWGHEANVHVAEVRPLWATRHRGAGPQRNTIMRMLDPAEAVCFHPDLRKSSGSADMKRQLDKAGIPVKVVAK